MRTPLLLVVSLGLGLLLARPASGSVVDSVADVPDATPGDGLCATSDGTCTLRAAIEEANAVPGLDVIELAPTTYRRAIAVQLDVTDDLDIVSLDGVATIDAVGLDRVLHIAPAVTVVLSKVVVRGGISSGAAGGGGIFNEGTLFASAVGVVVNTGDLGAGIHNTGMVRINDSFIEHNGPGSAILNEGSLVMERSVISRNQGLGVENWSSGGLFQVEIDHNLGGIGNYQLTANPALISVEQSALVYNGKLGALDNTGGVLVRRSTISGNAGARASAVLASGGGTLHLENVTIGDNGSTDTPTAALDGDGSATVRAVNTIVAGNRSSGGDPDCRITVTSDGHNLMSCPLTAPDPTTITGEARLAPLKAWRFAPPGAADEVTLAHALLPGSPAIDAGSCDVPSFDQRGVERPHSGPCDIGAFEDEPLCSGGVGIADARATIRQSPSTSTIRLAGRMSFANPANPVLDPVDDGLQLRVERLDAGGALLERTEATTPLTGVNQGCEGWRGADGGTRFSWRGSAAGAPLCFPDHVGKLVVAMKDQRAKHGVIAIKARATLPRVSPGTTTRVTVVLGADPLGGSSAGRDGTCAAQALACESDATGSRFECR